jgi:hypothetical protein
MPARRSSLSVRNARSPKRARLRTVRPVPPRTAVARVPIPVSHARAAGAITATNAVISRTASEAARASRPWRSRGESRSASASSAPRGAGRPAGCRVRRRRRHPAAATRYRAWRQAARTFSEPRADPAPWSAEPRPPCPRRPVVKQPLPPPGASWLRALCAGLAEGYPIGQLGPDLLATVRRAGPGPPS